MEMEEFTPFRLVGGTSLSLRHGHRMSDDIDLFTDAEYGSLDFYKLQKILRKEFPYCQGDCGDVVGFGASYIVGNSKDDCVKLDLYRQTYDVHSGEKARCHQLNGMVRTPPLPLNAPM